MKTNTFRIRFPHFLLMPFLIYPLACAGKVWPPTVNRLDVHVGVKTRITASTLITGTTSKPKKVILQRLNESGQAIGTFVQLYDNGKKGDRAAKDKIYSGRFYLEESQVGPVHVRAAALYKKTLRVSVPVTIEVNPPPFNPEPPASDL